MENIKIPSSVKAIAIFLIICCVFTVSSTLIALFVAAKKHHASMLASLIMPTILMVGGFGLLKLKTWSFWLVNVLLGVSFVSLFWDMIQIPAVRTTGWIVFYIFEGCLIIAMVILLFKKKHFFK